MKDQQIQSFRDLDAWNIAMELAVNAYAVATKLPLSERFELGAQIRRAAVSVPSNIAEGHATGMVGVFIRHVRIALGSLGELDTDLELGHRLQFLTKQEIAATREQLAGTRQLLHGLRRSLRKRQLNAWVR